MMLKKAGNDSVKNISRDETWQATMNRIRALRSEVERSNVERVVTEAHFCAFYIRRGTSVSTRDLQLATRIVGPVKPRVR